jgi:hypothetical protein
MDVTSVLVVGCGYIGLPLAWLAKSAGCRVLVTTRKHERLEVFKELGFSPLLWDVVTGIWSPTAKSHLPEIDAVVHAHPTYCTILAIMGREIPPVHYMIAAAGGDSIRCAPYATFGTAELSEHAARALEGRLACLLDHHGMIAIGKSLDKAMWLAVEVETLARQYHGCLQLGEPPLLSSAEIERVRQRMSGYGMSEG